MGEVSTHENRSTAARAAVPALLALGLVPFIWGYNWVVMKSALEYVGPFEFAAWRYVPAAIVLFGVMAVTRRPLLVRPFAPVALAGLLQTGVGTALSLFALRFGPAGQSALLCYTMPFWVVLLEWPLLRERPGRIQGIALVTAGVGLGLVFVGGAGVAAGPTVALVATASGVVWASGAVLTRRQLLRGHVDPLTMTAWQNLVGGMALLVAALLFPGRPTIWSPYLIFAVVYEILPATAVAWLLWNALLKHVSAGVASLAILATPLVGLLAGAIQLGERPRGMQAAGLVLVTLALALVGPLAVRQATRSRSA